MKLTVENNMLKAGPFEFGIVSKSENWSNERLQYFDALIVDGANTDFLREIVFRIRKHHNPELYLKPVFVLKSKSSTDLVVNELIDGIIVSLEQVEMVVEKVRTIHLKMNEIVTVKSASYEAEIINKMINLLTTRDKKDIKAIPYVKSGIGYFYPELSVNFASMDEFNAIRILKIAENEGLFTSMFNEQIYLCTNCSGGYLNYRELCHQYKSSHSKTEDLVHHFPCAYVGPINDFKNTIDDALNCPKSNKN